MTDLPLVTKDTLDRLGEQREFLRRKMVVKAVRVVGPFRVETQEGVVACENGWVAIDASGFPYPIAEGEFELLYTDDVNEMLSQIPGPLLEMEMARRSFVGGPSIDLDA